MIPHFSTPFRFVSGHAAVNDQNSIEEISDCVKTILATARGSRVELLDFGVDDITFRTQPVSLEDVIQAVLDQEPRASVVFEQHPDLLDQLIARVTASVSRQEVVTNE